MSSTKQKIVEAAVLLFNEKGVNNITLRDIAEQLGISTGNLAYHYKNKDFIIEEAFRQMEEERESILSGMQMIPSFDNINLQIEPLLGLAMRYCFFYLDTVHVIRSYPKIAKLHRNFIDTNIAYTKAVIDYSVGTGNMKPELIKGSYYQLAHTVWMILNFWIAQSVIRGEKKPSIAMARKAVWNLVVPHLTEKGIHNIESIQQTNANIKN